ncbi:MAG: prepilin peptidase [Kordia sp.]
MIIAYQDIKERSVYWFLFPIVACTAGYLYYTNTFFELFWKTSIVNLGIIMLVFLALQTYTKFKLRTGLKEVFGLGDALLFIGLCVAFPIASFIIFFVFSLLFSLIIHFVLKNKMKMKSVPLAGYMSVFFIGVYSMNWTGFLPNLYNI